jgi:hypothetical protein
MQLLLKRLFVISILLVLPICLFISNTHKFQASVAQARDDSLIYLPFVLNKRANFDIAVTDIQTPAAEVVLGDLIDIEVRVENVGELSVGSDIPVILLDTSDMVTIGSKIIQGLGNGTSATVIFGWDTGQVERDKHILLDSGFEFGGINNHNLTAVQNLSDANSNNDSKDITLPITVWKEQSNLDLNLILHENDLPHIIPHGGSWAVWLGGDENEVASITQVVTLPAQNPYLVYWYWIQSADFFECDSQFEGTAGLKINHTKVGEIHRLCGELDTGWQQTSVSLDQFSGQTVVLEFWITTPPNLTYGGPSLYIDDASIISQ